MKIRWPVFLVGMAVITLAACGDGGPSFIKHDTDHLLLFKRVTLAADARDRAEIELEVRTGSDFSKMAPDGTMVVLETSLGVFEDYGPRIEAQTNGGHVVVTLMLPEPSRLTVIARSHDAESRLVVDVNPDGSIRIDPN